MTDPLEDIKALLESGSLLARGDANWLIAEVERLRAELQLFKPAFSLSEAKERRLCRICGQPEKAVFVYNFGREYAHETCLAAVDKARDAK